MSRSRGRRQHLSIVNPNAAGIDIGSAEHWVAVPPDRDPKPVRKFGAFTGDLVAIADWLKQSGVDTVAMEATGVYWISLFQVLETRGFKVMVVNARHLRRVSTVNGFRNSTRSAFSTLPFAQRTTFALSVPSFAIARTSSTPPLSRSSSCRSHSFR